MRKVNFLTKSIMIITKTPLRIGLLGGGTDLPKFYCSKDSTIFGGSINKYVYVISNNLSKFSNEKYRFTYRQTESVQQVEEFKHPVTREVLKMYGQIKSINLATMSDLPGNTGLGSSSAFTVGLIKNLDLIAKKESSPLELAEKAIHIERSVLKEFGGVQDQIYSSLGGLRFYTLGKNKIIYSEDYSQSIFGKSLSSSICLIRVGGFRDSQKVHFSREEITELNINKLRKMSDLTLEFQKNFDPNSDDISNLAELINESWNYKKSLNPQSSSDSINSVIKSGLKLGATAAKLCGAGNSGFILFLCNPEIKMKLSNYFGENLYEEVQFTSLGSLPLTTI